MPLVERFSPNREIDLVNNEREAILKDSSVHPLLMPDEKKSKDNENSLPAGRRPANETAGSSEFTATSGSYPVRLPDQPQRATGGFVLEKAKDL